MSFKKNDIIHSGNYEEFFILYLDNELSSEQMNMVGDFLHAYPHLQSEFELLMSTRLPMEEFHFDKKELLAHQMKLADDELLLYIDNELDYTQKSAVEQKLNADKSYWLQHKILLQTKLNPFEKIIYPHKKELYHFTKKPFVFKPWMQTAAIIVIAVAGTLYLKNSSPASVENKPSFAVVHQEKNIEPGNRITKMGTPAPKKGMDLIAQKQNHSAIPVIKAKKKNKEGQNNLQPLTADHSLEETNFPVRKTTTINFNSDKMLAVHRPLVSVNNPDVTSSLLERTINNTAIDESKSLTNDRKGSVRGFLRKATRMIEKRTGIDPANNNGELLIGAIAVSLK